DRQTQAGATELPRTPTIDPIEAIEHAGAMLGRNAGPGIADLDAGPLRSVAHDDPNLAALRAVLDRVVHQIDERLPKEGTVDARHGVLAPPHAQPLSLLLRQDAELPRHVARDVAQIFRRAIQPHGAPIGPREREQAVDEMGQAVDLLQHASDHLAVVPVLAPLPEAHLAYRLHGREGGAQLVRRVGREASNLLEGGLQPPGGLFEDPRHLPKLVSGTLPRQSFGEPVGGDRTGAVRKPGHRSERSARERIAAARPK